MQSNQASISGSHKRLGAASSSIGKREHQLFHLEQFKKLNLALVFFALPRYKCASNMTQAHSLSKPTSPWFWVAVVIGYLRSILGLLCSCFSSTLLGLGGFGIQALTSKINEDQLDGVEPQFAQAVKDALSSLKLISLIGAGVEIVNIIASLVLLVGTILFQKRSQHGFALFTIGLMACAFVGLTSIGVNIYSQFFLSKKLEALNA
ncbi:MAG: hypothetical protein NZM37_12230, partial [Sandaracinaceae bacterium]|nr:hypothetical protein [Sandaracinaceae bacterium]